MKLLVSVYLCFCATTFMVSTVVDLPEAPVGKEYKLVTQFIPNPGPGRAPSGGGGGTPTFVQAIAAGNSGTTTAVTGTQNHTAGNLLHVTGSFREACASITLTPTNTAGDTFTAIGGLVDNANLTCTGQWYAKNINGNASDVVTLTASASVVNIGVSVMEYTGADASSPLDATPSAGITTVSNTATSGSFTTTTTNQVISCGGKFYAFGTTSAGSGYTVPSGATDGFHGTQSAEYKEVSSIQTGVTASISNDGSIINTIVCASFK